MEEFYFQDSTKGVVDDWIKDVEDDHKPVIQAYDNTDTRKNYGLGYENKTKNRQEEKHDVLLDRMTKQKKKKQEVKKEVLDEITHGIVEDEILSRAPSDKKRKLSQDDAKPNLAPTEFPSKNEIMGANEASSGEQQPKRIKTRSKQKNIRRDKRSVEFKPPHLQIGSKDYKGRPLTPETKAILGLPTKSKYKKEKR